MISDENKIKTEIFSKPEPPFIHPRIVELLVKKYSSIMHLKIYVDSVVHPDFVQQYIVAVEKHNEKLYKNAFLDAGFDLLLPPQKQKNNMMEEIPFFGNIVNPMNFGIKLSAEMITTNWKDMFFQTKQYSTGYYLYPRSSLSKTPLRLSNHVGIIDSGYRGPIIGMFDAIRSNGQDPDAYYLAKPLDRLVQICAPTLCPIFVEIVASEEELGQPTERNTGGFGSTNTAEKAP